MVIASFLISLFAFLLIGVPVSFSLLLTSFVLMLVLDLNTFQVIPQNMIVGTDNYALMAIPFFMMAGEIMTAGGLSKRIVDFANELVGYVRGGLGYATVISGMIFAGVSGTAVADTSAIGSILAPVMLKEGYDKEKSTALICAAGCIGPIIPPSYPMILYGVLAGVSIAKLFLGGFLPGIIAGLGIMSIWYFIVRKEGYQPKTTIKFSGKRLLKSFLGAIWALILPVIILGGIVSGVFTPTESGVIAVFYALFVCLFIYKELSIKDIPQILIKSARSTAVVIFVAATASSVAYMVTVGHVPQDLASFLLGITQNKYAILLLIDILLLAVGCVLDLTPAMLIFGPIFVPLVKSIGIDPLFFGIIMVIVLCIGLITPPVGTVLYVGCGLTKITMMNLAKALLPYILLYVALLFFLTLMPQLVLFIPNLF
ncbi:TRAP transporter large permease [Calorimonas adulescens]|uniref:TRAP transporter large permease n=1 Tax=Calorimonas adulescens TaxID=2606906 RepID=A0A5D8QDT1_9THEO|nr:TRAP transporter large permease [Calorimonas adulescens]TZE82775.1 TRAP transporter large permease [Calorimonas adulescens]